VRGIVKNPLQISKGAEGDFHFNDVIATRQECLDKRRADTAASMPERPTLPQGLNPVDHLEEFGHPVRFFQEP
jgi:hypothetical protein